MQPNALALGKEKRESSYRVTTKKENSEKVSFRSSTNYGVITPDLDLLRHQIINYRLVIRHNMIGVAHTLQAIKY